MFSTSIRTYWTDYYKERVRQQTERHNDGRASDSHYAQRMAAIGADTIYWASPEGCLNGCPEGSKGIHKMSCPKSVNGVG